MSTPVKGTFELTRAPEPPYESAEGVTLARTRITKTFRGPLEASSTLEMLSAITSVKGSAGYVAIERVSGALEGRAGSFVLQHHGVMRRGAPTLTVSVVPDSGSGALAGLSGHMTIDVIDGVHHYTFEYTIEAP